MSESKEQHTPTPWRLLKHGIETMGGGVVYTAGGAHRLVQIEGPNETTVGKLEILVFGDDDSPGMNTLAANARLIVRAVNSHEDSQRAIAYLVLNDCLKGAYWPEEIIAWAQELMTGEQRVGVEIVRSALALAEKES